MSPRSALSHSRSPYSRCSSSHPKSSRQQFSACGACRMRRVRCDLKDLPPSSAPHPCSNCKERGLNCVDEYADIKAVKLLRRGRRLQQVEAIYGKSKNANNGIFSARASSQIPTLSLDFFSSSFWTWFCVQRPILDPNEFRQRYVAHVEGSRPLGHEGGILAMLLVLWAATFGVDECGSLVKDDRNDSATFQHPALTSAGRPSRKANLTLSADTKDAEEAFIPAGKTYREKTSCMLREILELIDFHGIMRRPTYDGVRILFLTLPLMEEASALEKAAMCEVALSQARALCAPTPKPSMSSSPLPPFAAEESLLRARIYLYAHIQEGVLTTIKGGHLVYHHDDVDILRRTIYPPTERPVSSSGSLAPNSLDGNHLNSERMPAILDVQLGHLSAIPFHLSCICRRVHDVLTGPKAVQRVEQHGLIDANGMREIWCELDQCWQGLSAMKDDVAVDIGKVSTENFVNAWLIFIFECHNIILGYLKHPNFAAGSSDNTALPHATSRPSSSSSPYLTPHQLYLEARVRCTRLLPNVIRIIRYHLLKTTSDDDLNPLRWDTGLVRDGCFSAGLLCVSLYKDVPCLDAHEVKVEENDDCITPEEGVNLCLSALTEMRWVFSKSDERIEMIRSALKNTKERQGNRPLKCPPQSPGALQAMDLTFDRSHSLPYSDKSMHLFDIEAMTNPRERRPSLPLSIVTTTTTTHRQVESAPNTAYTMGGPGSDEWPTYTPPATSSTLDINQSPTAHSMASPGSYKSSHEDSIFYYVPEALDHFNYSVIMPTNIPAIAQTMYHPSSTFIDPRDLHTVHQDSPDGLDCLFTRTDASLQASGIDSYLDSYHA